MPDTAELQIIILADRQLFIFDTQVNDHTDAERMAEIALLAVKEVSRFVSLPVLHYFRDQALEVLVSVCTEDARRAHPDKQPADLEIDGEMRADQALSAATRDTIYGLHADVQRRCTRHAQCRRRRTSPTTPCASSAIL